MKLELMTNKLGQVFITFRRVSTSNIDLDLAILNPVNPVYLCNLTYAMDIRYNSKVPTNLLTRLDSLFTYDAPESDELDSLQDFQFDSMTFNAQCTSVRAILKKIGGYRLSDNDFIKFMTTWQSLMNYDNPILHSSITDLAPFGYLLIYEHFDYLSSFNESLGDFLQDTDSSLLNAFQSLYNDIIPYVQDDCSRLLTENAILDQDRIRENFPSQIKIVEDYVRDNPELSDLYLVTSLIRMMYAL